MKKITLVIAGILFLSLSISCKPSNKNPQATAHTETPIQTKTVDGLKKAYFASGCFWCSEGIYESVRGVKEVISGYSGGKMQNPTYENHGDHAETVEVIYDPKLISYGQLVDVYFGSQNVTQVNGQGPDTGSSYRSIVFYQNLDEKEIIDTKIALMNHQLNSGQVAAQVMPFQKFWEAEDYHQNYKKNNPNNPYIQNVSLPRIKGFQKKFPGLLKTDSTSEKN